MNRRNSNHRKNTDQKRRLRRNKKLEENRRRLIDHREELLGKILKFDAPELSLYCIDISSGYDLSFVSEMKKVICTTANGAGLAASQIGYLYRVCVLRPDPYQNVLKVLINPHVKETSVDLEDGEEGCLSYPGVVCKVDRYREIEVEYLDEHFIKHRYKFKGFMARVVQHEMDHMNGICKVGEEWKRTQKHE